MTGDDYATYILHEDDCGETLGLALVRGPAGLNMYYLRHEYLGLFVRCGLTDPKFPVLSAKEREAHERSLRSGDREAYLAGFVDWLVAERGFKRVDHVVTEV
jgi:hypothetical protein